MAQTGVSESYCSHYPCGKIAVEWTVSLTERYCAPNKGEPRQAKQACIWPEHRQQKWMWIKVFISVIFKLSLHGVLTVCRQPRRTLQSPLSATSMKSSSMILWTWSDTGLEGLKFWDQAAKTGMISVGGNTFPLAWSPNSWSFYNIFPEHLLFSLFLFSLQVVRATRTYRKGCLYLCRKYGDNVVRQFDFSFSTSSFPHSPLTPSQPSVRNHPPSTELQRPWSHQEHYSLSSGIRA